MRIIAGKYRGRNLKSPPTLGTRPTSDRLRETLFNILAPRIAGARFLDLCAGSGAVGIEALSRGAAHVTFVDRSRKMYALIETNLKLLKVGGDETEIVSREALDFLKRNIKREEDQFDLIFFDPPYATDYLRVIGLFGQNGAELLAGNGTLIVEHHHKNSLPEEVGSIIRSRILKQGDSALSFFSMKR